MTIPRVLIIKHGSIGDIFMSLDAVKAIQKNILTLRSFQLIQVIEFLMTLTLILKKLLIIVEVSLTLVKFCSGLLVKNMTL